MHVSKRNLYFDQSSHTMNLTLKSIQELNLLTTTAQVGKKGFELIRLTVFCKPNLFDTIISLAVKNGAPFEKTNSGINLYFEA